MADFRQFVGQQRTHTSEKCLPSKRKPNEPRTGHNHSPSLTSAVLGLKKWSDPPTVSSSFTFGFTRGETESRYMFVERVQLNGKMHSFYSVFLFSPGDTCYDRSSVFFFDWNILWMTGTTQPNKVGHVSFACCNTFRCTLTVAPWNCSSGTKHF